MPDVSAEHALTLRSLAQPGIAAARLYWRAIVAIQAVALLLLIGYFHIPAVTAFCRHLAELRQQWGIGLAILASVLAGVILPEIAKFLLLPRASRRPIIATDLLASALFFAGSGAIVDTQYRLLTAVLGADMTMGLAVRKMLIDQFLMTPLYGVPYWILVYAWKANGFRILPTLRPIGPRWYLLNVTPLLIPAWVYWIPMTLMIYSLPAQLQFALFTLALAAWSLVMIFVATSNRRSTLARSGSTPR